MNWLTELFRRLDMLLHREKFDAELEEEMRLHTQLRAEKQMASGLSPEEARFAAQRQFGNTTMLKEKSHAVWGWNWLENFLQDVRYGVRAMRRSPGVTFVALLSLALGIGANTAIFSMMNAVMLRSLPVKEPKQLVLFGSGLDEGVSDGFPNTELYSYPFFRAMQKQNQVFESVAATFSSLNRLQGTIEGRSTPEPMSIQMVSGSYFPMLGVEPFMGRAFTDEDDKTKDANPIAMVSYGWWKRGLAGDPAALGKKITIGSTLFTIVGVAPPEFFGTKVGESPDIWVPLSMQKEIPPGNDGYTDNMAESLHLMARLKPGVSDEQAAANTNVLFQQILRSFPNAPLTPKNLAAFNTQHVQLTPLATGFSRLRFMFSTPLKILMAVVALVLLIACANIANLLLARSTARAREFAMRQALGARRSRLIRQLLTESLVLAITGGGLGIAFAMLANRFLLRMVSSGSEVFPLDLSLDVSLDVRLLLFTLGVTVATALLFGTLPAFRATRLELTESLKDGRGPASSGSRTPLAKTLIVSQVALSLVLLAGAGLFLHSLINLNNVDTGFNRVGVLRLQIDPASVGYVPETAHVDNLYQQIEERVGAIPGVRAASLSLFTFDEGTWNNGIWVSGYELAHQDVDVHHNVVGNGYFAAMGIPVLAGRTFGPEDTSSSQRVAIISESMARNLFPQGSPIGRHFGFHGVENSNSLVVIGIVKDAKVHSLDEEKQYVDYIPRQQANYFFLRDLEVRYTGNQAATIGAVRQTLLEIDSHLPISDVKTLEQQVERSMPMQRLIAQFSAFFGFLAVFLSCIGIYGLMSYMVTRRTNEIGVRMALGANRSRVLWLVMREILVLLSAGICIGIIATLAAARLISSVLFGLSPTDPLNLIAAVILLLLVAALAGYLPARRASRVDPMIALRYE